MFRAWTNEWEDEEYEQVDHKQVGLQHQLLRVFAFNMTYSHLSKGKYMKLGLPGFGCNFCPLRVMRAYTEV